MAKKTVEPQDDGVEEMEATAKEQTEHEFDTADLMAAAERCTADRCLDFIRIVNRPKPSGCDGFPMSDRAVQRINEGLEAAGLRLKRIFENDLPRERISWD